MGRVRTFILMFVLVIIFMFVGSLIGGHEGMKTAFYAAVLMNFFAYFFSDTLVLKQYHAHKVDKKHNPRLYDIVERLAAKALLPMPKVYIIDEEVPNAFATGRNPKHAAVAATSGLLAKLSDEEVEGVLAHEMSHVKHYDILTGSIAAVFASAIAYLGNFARTNNRSYQRQRNNSLMLIIAVVLMPIAATIIQMSISRTREYAADRGAALLTGHPEWLMNALLKLEDYAKSYQMKNISSTTAHMFIVNPFNGVSKSLNILFSTHPSTIDRVEKLKNMIGQI